MNKLKSQGALQDCRFAGLPVYALRVQRPELARVCRCTETAVSLTLFPMTIEFQTREPAAKRYFH
jgi:hypothetical protein